MVFILIEKRAGVEMLGSQMGLFFLVFKRVMRGY